MIRKWLRLSSWNSNALDNALALILIVVEVDWRAGGPFLIDLWWWRRMWHEMCIVVHIRIGLSLKVGGLHVVGMHPLGWIGSWLIGMRVGFKGGYQFFFLKFVLLHDYNSNNKDKFYYHHPL